MKPKTNDTGLINNQPTNTGLKQKTKEPVKRILNKKPSTGKPKELDWSQKLKVLVTVAVADSLFAGKTRPITKDCSDVTIKHWKLIKYFIQSLLTQQRTELLEEIKKLELKHSINPNSPSRERKIIYNSAISDVLKILEEE